MPMELIDLPLLLLLKSIDEDHTGDMIIMFLPINDFGKISSSAKFFINFPLMSWIIFCLDNNRFQTYPNFLRLFIAGVSDVETNKNRLIR